VSKEVLEVFHDFALASFEHCEPRTFGQSLSFDPE